MTIIRTLLAATLLVGAPLTFTACKDKTSAAAEANNAQGLIALIDSADAAIAADDMETLFRISTPEPMIDAILESQGLTGQAEKDAAREMMETMLMGMFEQIDITSHDVDKGAIRYETSASGATVAYVPMSMSMNMAGTDITTRGQYIGLQRDGEWFLLTPSDANSVNMIKQAFPELEGEDIQPNTME